MTNSAAFQRMSLGGPSTLPDFSGQDGDYSYVGHIKIRETDIFYQFKVYGLGFNGLSLNEEQKKDYTVHDVDCFLKVIEDFLKEKGWYLCYVSRSAASFSGKLIIEGALYTKKEVPTRVGY